MAVEMKVLKTYDGGSDLDKVTEKPEGITAPARGLIYANSIIEVQDKQRAAFLQSFGIAEPTSDDVVLDLETYSDEELANMKQKELRAAAKKLDIEGYGGKTNDELRAEIRKAQGPAPEAPEETPEPTHDPIDTTGTETDEE